MKVYLDTIGCRLNQSEIETMARGFRAAGHEIVASAEGADLAVVNTCAVTADAAADSRQMIRHLARAGVPQIVPTGCWTTLQMKEAASLPNVLHAVSNQEKENLVAQFNSEFRILNSEFDLEPLSRQPLPGLHRRTRAFIKVQDGCDNACTFCITTVARGESRSRPLEDVIRDIQFALAGGTKEIMLTGVHLGSWGQEWGRHLRELVAAILRETNAPRLRLSSLEPWDLDADFFQLWENPRLMPHLHLPLQSGSESTLRRMARKTTPASFRELVAAARTVIPSVAITTDVIAGFPGETETEFTETLDFVREMDFAGGHVFTYSPRPGTGAAKMKGQTRPEVRKKRNAILREAFEESSKAYRQKFVGRRMAVLWESVTELDEWGWQMEGWTENYLRVSAAASSPRWNEVDEVELTDASGDILRGVIRDSG
ncbi:MAG: tRNA (N(6)-L-threonylcarbamoyladenosine(37)-C(2))-methylthiotransferase MtaB [Candidatus Auribacter fodinae]|uniref:tRNA (N(6)-L-threonylcarbamoyladenosine(37)-C(2))-methylthiotransferase MtaB n=1 Tax=Candidatus Auribacter fodinae TaxID=2093366 RepID=A0A3A4R8G5_9BACT|nr:MAG: tRNA (N(6)-L-threonylcarbamoyladenosine(37)-C(2))-methylthiotransferase MtaB [Candidatus Auribacter fodinae]